MDKLKKLLSKCKCSVCLEVNKHRDYYQTVEDYLSDMECGGPIDVDQEVRDKMIELDTVVEVQFYPDTPIGFYNILHYDLDTALDEALKCD